MDAESLDPLTRADLAPGAVLERGHLDGARLDDMTAPDVHLLECLVSDCQGGACHLPGLRATGTAIVGSSFATLDAPGATIFSGRIEGVRVGVLNLTVAEVSVFRIVSSRIDVLSLSGAKVSRLEIIDSRIGLLDLRSARLREVTVTGGSVAELVPTLQRERGLDVSRTQLDLVTEPSGLRGMTVSQQQALAWGPQLAAHLGATVVD